MTARRQVDAQIHTWDLVSEAEVAEHSLSLLGKRAFTEKIYTWETTKMSLFVIARLVQVLVPVCGTISAFCSTYQKEAAALSLPCPL